MVWYGKKKMAGSQFEYHDEISSMADESEMDEYESENDESSEFSVPRKKISHKTQSSGSKSLKEHQNTRKRKRSCSDQEIDGNEIENDKYSDEVNDEYSEEVVTVTFSKKKRVRKETIATNVDDGLENGAGSSNKVSSKKKRVRKRGLLKRKNGYKFRDVHSTNYNTNKYRFNRILFTANQLARDVGGEIMIFSYFPNKEIGTTGAFDFGTRTKEIVKRSTTQKFLHYWGKEHATVEYRRKAVRHNDSAENSAAKVNTTEPDASSDEIIGAHLSEASDSDDMEISQHEASESYVIDTCGLDEFTIEDENILGLVDKFINEGTVAEVSDEGEVSDNALLPIQNTSQVKASKPTAIEKALSTTKKSSAKTAHGRARVSTAVNATVKSRNTIKKTAATTAPVPVRVYTAVKAAVESRNIPKKTAATTAPGPAGESTAKTAANVSGTAKSCDVRTSYPSKKLAAAEAPTGSKSTASVSINTQSSASAVSTIPVPPKAPAAAKASNTCATTGPNSTKGLITSKQPSVNSRAKSCVASSSVQAKAPSTGKTPTGLKSTSAVKIAIPSKLSAASAIRNQAKASNAAASGLAQAPIISKTSVTAKTLTGLKSTSTVKTCAPSKISDVSTVPNKEKAATAATDSATSTVATAPPAKTTAVNKIFATSSTPSSAEEPKDLSAGKSSVSYPASHSDLFDDWDDDVHITTDSMVPVPSVKPKQNPVIVQSSLDGQMRVSLSNPKNCNISSGLQLRRVPASLIPRNAVIKSIILK